MERLSAKQEKILSLIKPYAISTIDDPNTENTIICIILGSLEYSVEDKVIDILENSDGHSFDGIVKKIISVFPPVEIVDAETDE